MKYLYCLLMLGIALLPACKDDDPIVDPTAENEIKCTLNGSVFSNKFITLNDFLDTETSVGYIDSLDATQVKTIAQFNNSPVQFLLLFPNQGTGSYTYSEPTFPVTAYPAADKYFELSIGNDTLLGGLAIQQINLNISQYDSIGGRIKGTFNGVVYDYTTGSELPVTISNGQFDMERQY